MSSPQRSNTLPSRNLSIASMNCHGLADYAKRRDVLHFLKTKQYSIYCLQDVHSAVHMEDRIRAEWGLDCYFSSFKSNARGVAILFNNNFEYKVFACNIDENGNYLALSLETQGYKITLIMVQINMTLIFMRRLTVLSRNMIIFIQLYVVTGI